MLKKTGLSLLVSLGVLSAAELASPTKDTDGLAATTEAAKSEAGSPSTGPKAKVRNSKKVRIVADEEKTNSDSEGSAGEKDTKLGPRSETVVLGTQLPETQLIPSVPETQLMPSDSTLGDSRSSDVLVTETPAKKDELVEMTQAPASVVEPAAPAEVVEATASVVEPVVSAEVVEAPVSVVEPAAPAEAVEAEVDKKEEAKE